MPDVFTYDLNSADSTLLAVSYVRWRINDKDASFPIFYDDEIKVSLFLENNNIKRAAALSLETIAANEVLVQKVVKILQFATDGAKVAAELRQNAKLLRDQADTEVDQSSAGFDIAEWIVDDFSYRARIANEAARQS